LATDAHSALARLDSEVRRRHEAEDDGADNGLGGAVEAVA
jgi:hypothetical protein